MLHAATQLRPLWMKVVRIMMENHGILPYTYNVQTLDIGTLKKIALGPARFSSLIQKTRATPSPKSLLPTSAFILFGPSMSDEKLGISKVIEVHSLFLFAGGRFLFLARDIVLSDTKSDDNRLKVSCAEIWDLNAPGSMKAVVTKILPEIYHSCNILSDERKMAFDLVVQGERRR